MPLIFKLKCADIFLEPENGILSLNTELAMSQGIQNQDSPRKFGTYNSSVKKMLLMSTV